MARVDGPPLALDGLTAKLSALEAEHVFYTQQRDAQGRQRLVASGENARYESERIRIKARQTLRDFLVAEAGRLNADATAAIERGDIARAGVLLPAANELLDLVERMPPLAVGETPPAGLWLAVMGEPLTLPATP